MKKTFMILSLVFFTVMLVAPPLVASVFDDVGISYNVDMSNVYEPAAITVPAFDFVPVAVMDVTKAPVLAPAPVSSVYGARAPPLPTWRTSQRSITYAHDRL